MGVSISACVPSVVRVFFQFDQVCFEDEVTNRLQESLTVFDNVCNSKWFEATPMILLFNKIDLFKEKVVDWKQPLSICFQVRLILGVWVTFAE